MADLYQPSGAEELSRRFLRDVELSALQAGHENVPVVYGSDAWLTSQGIAGIALSGFRNIALSESDQSVLDATGVALERIRIAYGLPEVSAERASGKLVIRVSGPTTIPNGQAFLYPNGKTGKVVGVYVNPTDRSEINVLCDTPGKSGNLKAGDVVRFIGAPINIATEARVSLNTPITGGSDVEDDSRKRLRIMNVLQNKPAGANWAHLRQVVLNFSGGVSNCVIYPALGGPSSVKIVPIKNFDIDINDFSRSIPDSLLDRIRDKIWSTFSGGDQNIVQTCASEYTDLTLKLSIPESSQSSGNGQGWVDRYPWPSLVSGDSGKVTLSSPNATYDTFTLSANTTTAPIDGQTHISWFSSSERKFYTGLIVSHSGSSGAWIVTLDRPLIDKTGAGPVAGDYVSPSCQNIDGYREDLIKMFSRLGPGENTSDVTRLPRAKRHPYITEELPSSITNASLKTLVGAHPEITDFSIGYILKSSPTVPANATLAPNILIPRRFGVYPI